MGKDTPPAVSEFFKDVRKKDWAKRKAEGRMPPREYFVELGRRGGKAPRKDLTIA